MKLPPEYIAMLKEHCAKLEEIEDWLTSNGKIRAVPFIAAHEIGDLCR
jgi:hypothetical protein